MSYESESKCTWCLSIVYCDCLERLYCETPGAIGHRYCGPCAHDNLQPRFTCIECCQAINGVLES